jgi:hypothetical protein
LYRNLFSAPAFLAISFAEPAEDEPYERDELGDVVMVARLTKG